MTETRDERTDPLASPLLSEKELEEIPFAPRSSLFGPRFLMIFSLLTSFGLMFAHHSYCAYLDGKPVGHHFRILDQSRESAVSNLIAYLAKIILSNAIGVAFVQMLWLYLRRHAHSIEHLDAVIASHTNPFSPSSLPAWFSSAVTLTLVAVFGTLMAAVTILSPGALTVTLPHLSLPRPCIVQTVNITGGNLGSYSSNGGINYYAMPIAVTRTLTKRVLMQGTYVPPPLLCHWCQYNIQFIAPALNCTNTTDSVDFATLLPFSNVTKTVWNASYVFDDSGLVISAAGTGKSNDDTPREAARCIAYNATYDARIYNTNTSSTVTLNNAPQLHNKIPRRLIKGTQAPLQLAALAGAMAEAIDKEVIYTWQKYDFSASTSLVADSALLDGFSNHWQAHPVRDLPLLMQNVSLSLLSGFVNWEKKWPIMFPLQTTCYFAVSEWSYNPVQLFATYGSCIAVASMCVLFGFYAVHANGAEETLDFSRLLGAISYRLLPRETAAALSEKSLLTMDKRGFISWPETAPAMQVHP